LYYQYFGGGYSRPGNEGVTDAIINFGSGFRDVVFETMDMEGKERRANHQALQREFLNLPPEIPMPPPHDPNSTAYFAGEILPPIMVAVGSATLPAWRGQVPCNFMPGIARGIPSNIVGTVPRSSQALAAGEWKLVIYSRTAYVGQNTTHGEM